jgi:hypothetical protein
MNASENASESGFGQNAFVCHHSNGWCRNAWPFHPIGYAESSESPRSFGTSRSRWRTRGQNITIASATPTKTTTTPSRAEGG